MSDVVDLRELSLADLSDVAARIERMDVLRMRLGSSLVRLGSAQGEGSLLPGEGSVLLTEAVGHLTFNRLLDLDLAATRLLRILFLDGLAFGEEPLEGLTEEALLQRLAEILRRFPQEGIGRLTADGGDEGVHLPVDPESGRVGVALDIGPQQAGHELPPDVGDLSGLVASERHLISHLSHPDPLVPRRSTPPP
ncbi:hypothetical protein V5F41_12450 [Xanthobacter autotrophicus]|uniref:hypothetical protein n=1 Tax=Xanthobacter autotrophicus TaxID=280 RepID=UPI0037283760